MKNIKEGSTNGYNFFKLNIFKLTSAHLICTRDDALVNAKYIEFKKYVSPIAITAITTLSTNFELDISPQKVCKKPL
jgi:hypothetical protein